MALDIYTPYQLAQIMFDPRQTVTTSHWLDMFFPNTFLSTQEEIAFSKLNASRRIAPFMLPNEPGKPIYRREGERIESFKPAYTKPKDAVRPTEMIALTPGELVRRESLMSPQARYNREVNRIVVYHRNAIQRLWDYMAAKAILNGALTVNYGQGVSVTIDFGRDAGQTVVLGAGARWGDAGINIFDTIQSYVDTVANAEFGGSATDIILGATAAIPFMADASSSTGSLKDKLDTTFRGSEDVAINRGIIRVDPMNPFTLLGRLANGLNVWRYAGPASKFQNNDGSFTDIMDPRDILVASRAVDGIRAYGAILDSAANLEVADIFTKMWDQEDPSARFIMSQSAPLTIPVNPNCTMRVRVVA
jgi:hypothetical protein